MELAQRMSRRLPQRARSAGREPSPETSYARVARQLRETILAGEIAPGERLTMIALADRYRVSVQPVREALQQLEGEGLVEIVPNQGARVCALDRTRIIHAHEIGMALESFFCRQFADTASPAAIRHLQTLQLAHDEACEALNWPEIDLANKEIHHFINTYNGNVEGAEVIARTFWLSTTLLDRKGRGPDFARRVRQEHHALIDAFKRRDPDAASEIGLAHVRHTCEAVLAAFEALYPSAAPAGTAAPHPGPTRG